MKIVLSSLLIILVSSGFSVAQFSIHLDQFPNIETLEDEISPFTDAMHSGLGVLTFTAASSPSSLGFKIGIYSGFSSFDKIQSISMGSDLLRISNGGIQAGLGTSGFEFNLRYLPNLIFQDNAVNSTIKMGASGFGIKYDLSDLVSITGIQSVSAYVEYNSLYFSKTDSTESTQSYHKFDFSSVSFGTIVGYDFAIIRIFGKTGIEFGKTTINWNQWTGRRNSGEIGSTGFRYAIGLTFYGFQIEIGGRNSRFSLGAGYGISF